MKSYKLTFVISWLLLLPFQSIFSQENEEYLAVYDSIIGKENLLITNGLFHYNKYRIFDKKNIYFKNEFYTKGSVKYLNQTYSNVMIKYDVFKDELVYRPSGESEKSGLVLIKENISSFVIHNKKFIKLKSLENEDESIYLEENLKGNDFTFYIHHSKYIRELISGKIIYDDFNDENEFYIFKDNSLKKIKSKSGIIKLFPDHKELIKKYYTKNNYLYKNNRIVFYSNLFLEINTLTTLK